MVCRAWDSKNISDLIDKGRFLLGERPFHCIQPPIQKRVDNLAAMNIGELFRIVALHKGEAPVISGHPGGCNRILLVGEAQGFVWVDHRQVPVVSQSLLLITGRQAADLSALSATGYLLTFDDSFWQKTPLSANNCKELLFNLPAPQQQFHLDHADSTMLQALFAATLQDFDQPDYSNKPDVLAAYLKIIIIKIANIYRLLTTETGTYDNKLYNRFIALVRDKGNQLHRVSDYAALLDITTRKLSDVCRGKGQNPKELITQHIVSEAKVALQFSSRPIKEIAAGLHFSNPYQFSNFFKTQTGSSPADYRDQFVKIGIR